MRLYVSTEVVSTWSLECHDQHIDRTCLCGRRTAPANSLFLLMNDRPIEIGSNNLRLGGPVFLHGDHGICCVDFDVLKEIT